MARVLTVVGARPQFIKAAVVSRELAATGGIAEVLVHTGQHYDANMSEIFFSELRMNPPDLSLEIGSGPHGEQTGKMLAALERAILSEAPDLVLVYGDTNSTAAGALAAAKLNVPVAHVEAGLRSFNRRMPEEVNRVIADHLAAVHFAPTDTAVNNLASEGIRGNSVQLVGDVMFDAALWAQRELLLGTRSAPSIPEKYALATIHRAENTDDPDCLSAIVEALIEISAHIPVIMPLHPRTRARLRDAHLLGRLTDTVCVMDPVGYIEMIGLESSASVVVTDSGGVQKEAFFCGVPCVTLRAETEWVELVELGWNTLAPPFSADISQTVLGQIDAMRQTRPTDLYGGGHAAMRIAQYLMQVVG